MVSALFRDAKLADLIEKSPCIFDERQLEPLARPSRRLEAFKEGKLVRTPTPGC
jgi:hypothetical protein